MQLNVTVQEGFSEKRSEVSVARFNRVMTLLLLPVQRQNTLKVHAWQKFYTEFLQNRICSKQGVKTDEKSAYVIHKVLSEKNLASFRS